MLFRCCLPPWEIFKSTGQKIHIFVKLQNKIIILKMSPLRLYTLGQIRGLTSRHRRAQCTKRTPSAQFTSRLTKKYLSLQIQENFYFFRRPVPVLPLWCPVQSLTWLTGRQTAREATEISFLLEKPGSVQFFLQHQ